MLPSFLTIIVNHHYQLIVVKCQKTIIVNHHWPILNHLLPIIIKQQSSLFITFLSLRWLSTVVQIRDLRRFDLKGPIAMHDMLRVNNAYISWSMIFLLVFDWVTQCICVCRRFCIPANAELHTSLISDIAHLEITTQLHEYMYVDTYTNASLHAMPTHIDRHTYIHIYSLPYMQMYI